MIDEENITSAVTNLSLDESTDEKTSNSDTPVIENLDFGNESADEEIEKSVESESITNEDDRRKLKKEEAELGNEDSVNNSELKQETFEEIQQEPSNEIEKEIKGTESGKVPVKRLQINWQQEIDNFNKEKLLKFLNAASEDELVEVLKETEQRNSYISNENAVYEFILNQDETVQNTLESIEVEEVDPSAQESLRLSYPAKCYFAKKKMEHIDKNLEIEKTGYEHEIQNLKFQLESLNMSLQNLKDAKEKFDKNIRIGGRHPVTKKIILQKVAKYFDDSIRTKMALTNLYKIQIQGDIMERNKILSQIKAQEKRLAALDITEFKEAQFEYKKSCRDLAAAKEQLGKFKSKFSRLLQSVTELKRALEKEQTEMERMKSAVSKFQHLQEVLVSEMSRNDQKVLELQAAMRKIKLDPRRHNLPEVIEYAAAKRENSNLKKSVKKWKKKVDVAEQEKRLYLDSLCKKSV